MLVITMDGDSKPPPRRVELYVRSLQPEGYCQQQASLLDRVAGLVARDVVSERQVHVCGCQVPASVADANTTAGVWILTRISQFRQWADRNDCTLEPAMEDRDVGESLVDTGYRAVRLPAILLAEFRGTELCCVTPHRADETVRTVADRIAQLEDGDPTEFEPLPDAAGPSPPRRAESDAADADTGEEPLTLPGR